MQHIFAAVREYERLFGVVTQEHANSPKTPERVTRPAWITPEVLPRPASLARKDLENKVREFFSTGKPNKIVGSILRFMDPKNFILDEKDSETSCILMIVYFYSIVNTLKIDEITMVQSLNLAMREYDAPQDLLDEADFYIKKWRELELTQRLPDGPPPRDKPPDWLAIRESIEANQRNIVVLDLVTQILALRLALPRCKSRRFDDLWRQLAVLRRSADVSKAVQRTGTAAVV